MYKEWLVELSKLVRVKNLLIIAATQYFVRLFVISPVFFNYKIEHSLNGWQFALFVLATVCIAAAGYIINDYFDVEIDRINKPQKMSIGNFFTKRQAFQLHLIFNVAGTALGFLAAWFAGNIKLGFIFPVVAGLLWFYAKTFKKVFFLGNLLVGILTALTIFITAYYETNLISSDDMLVATANQEILPVVIAYTVFALMATLIREIIKDMQDVEGDRQYGCKTVPVVVGIPGAKWLSALLALVLIGLLFFAQQEFYRQTEFIKISYILIALQLPLIGLLFYLIPAAQKEDFAKLSDGMKIITLLGVLSMPVFHYML